MANKKGSFITIIVLLSIFIPLTIIGIINRNKNIDENPNHEFVFDNHLWFYNEQDELINKYECVNKVCNLSIPIIDDYKDINYFKEGKINQVPVIDNKYAFITDGDLIYLYDIENNINLQSYKAIKNYNNKIVNNSFILQNSEGLWGVLSFSNGLSNPVKFEYDYVGLLNRVNNEGSLFQDKFIVKKDNKWYLINDENSSISGYIDNPIIDYTSEYIFSKMGDTIKIYSYENYEYLSNFKIKDYILVDKYIGIITDKFLILYNNLESNRLKVISLENKTGDIKLELNNNKIDVKINNELLESVEVS